MSTVRAPQRAPGRTPDRPAAKPPTGRAAAGRAATAAAATAAARVPAPAPERQPYERRNRPAPAPLRLVERTHARRRAGALGVLVTMIVFAALFGAVVSSTWRVQSQQHLDDLNAKVASAQTRYEQLRLEVAELDSPARIVDVATHRLGMVQPGATTYLLPPPNDGTTPTTTATDTTGGEAAQGDWSDVKPFLGAAP